MASRRSRRLKAPDFHDKRVRLVRVARHEALAVEGHELMRHVGEEGVADSLDYDGNFKRSVSVLFHDGCRLHCLPEELELCSDLPPSGTSVPTSGRAADSFVQACIAHVGFTDSLEGLNSLLSGGKETDMESLLWPSEADDSNWTAPRWLTRGDVFFFYHTKKALQRIKALVKSALREDGGWRSIPDSALLLERLVDQLEIAKQYAGTIFACAEVTGPPSYWRNEDDERDRNRHWRSNIYAAIGRPHVFARPVPDAAFHAQVTISPGGAITPLHGRSFERIKELVAAKNSLPGYLLNARPGGVSFRDVDRSNWMRIACAPRARFIDESQLRAYLLDYLLEELKDPRTTVYEECRCEREGKSPSFADYFVRIGGRWVPVEAKLNVRAERDLPSQIARYVGVNEFVPTKGVRAGEVITSSVASTCVVADVEGLYFVSRAGYVECSPDAPLLRRAAINRASIQIFRERLRQVCEL